MPTFDVNFVPLERLTNFLSNVEMQQAKPFYDDMYAMRKVIMMLPLLEKTLIHKLKMRAYETCPFVGLANWEKVMQRIVYLFTYLDRAPP